MATDRKSSSRSSGRSKASRSKSTGAKGRSRGARSRTSSDEEDPPIDAEFTDPLDDDGDEARTSPIPDLFRRAMAMGLSGFFSTEEAFRRALGETLPKDWVDFANEQSERTRNEMIERMSAELGRVIQQIDIAELTKSLMEGQTLEIDARIRLVPEDDDDGDAERERVRLRLAGDRNRR